jgi:hypothetical protein
VFSLLYFPQPATIRKRAIKEIKMTQVFKAYVYQDNRCFIGEIDGININTNIAEIKNTPIEFYASSKQELLADMIKFLKGTGRTGVLRVAN